MSDHKTGPGKFTQINYIKKLSWATKKSEDVNNINTIKGCHLKVHLHFGKDNVEESVKKLKVMQDRKKRKAL